MIYVSNRETESGIAENVLRPGDLGPVSHFCKFFAMLDWVTPVLSGSCQSFVSWFQMTGVRPKMWCAMARTRLSLWGDDDPAVSSELIRDRRHATYISPYGGRQYFGTRPPVRSLTIKVLSASFLALCPRSLLTK